MQDSISGDPIGASPLGEGAPTASSPSDELFSSSSRLPSHVIFVSLWRKTWDGKMFFSSYKVHSAPSLLSARQQKPLARRRDASPTLWAQKRTETKWSFGPFHKSMTLSRLTYFLQPFLQQALAAGFAAGFAAAFFAGSAFAWTLTAL